MSTSEQLTLTLPAELAEMVRTAVAGGDYASPSEVVGEALREWLDRGEVSDDERTRAPPRCASFRRRP